MMMMMMMMMMICIYTCRLASYRLLEVS